MRNSLLLVKYIVGDYLSALAAWALFFYYRKQFVESPLFGYQVPFEPDRAFFLGLLIIPPFWIFIYFLSGYYREVFRKSRLSEFSTTFFSALLGALIIFFFLILDDTVSGYRDYYTSFLVLFFLHFLLTWIIRSVITYHAMRLIRRGKIFFNALLIGSGRKARQVFEKVSGSGMPAGTRIIGYLNVGGLNPSHADGMPEYLGGIENLEDIIVRRQISEVIVAIENAEHKWIEFLMRKLVLPDLSIRTIPEISDILTGKMKVTSIFDAPFADISFRLMAPWQENIKLVFDLMVSFIILTLFSPVLLLIAIVIKAGSEGPVFFCHERIGRYGKPFTLYKFRSMKEDAETGGPQLSSAGDPRVTPFGRFLRKTKLDELPNFINVLKGEMSIVGPRPERKYYIDQIMEKEPSFAHLFKVKPGITSWGQVRFGYAENTDQMLERLKYDLMYLDNMSLFVDFKILIHTFLILFRGRSH